MVNIAQLREMGGLIYEDEITLEEGANDLFAVPLVNGEPLINDDNELIYAGVPFRTSLENSIQWENFIAKFTTLERDFKEEPVSEENPYEYKGNTYISHNEFIKVIKTEVLDEYEEWRNEVKPGNRYQATRISLGMPQFDGTPKSVDTGIQ